MGNYIILGIWGNDVYYKYSLFVLLISILCNCWGLYILMPKEMNTSLWYNIRKSFIQPPMLALIVGMVCGLLNLAQYVPDFLINAFKNAGDCQGPVAMILAGFVIGGYNFKRLLVNKKVYVISFLRLLVIPSAMMIVLKLLGIHKEIMILALIAFATPIGLNTIVYPTAYGGDTKIGASMSMISHVLSVVTIPLMYYIFIVWL
ncbi:MAG: hypothetical protein E7393_04560 [Ruminococcaceae bacterium]|nr:hypothetical protein [Oscillospiraceae bacterium]